jgi:hypothetical protein
VLSGLMIENEVQTETRAQNSKRMQYSVTQKKKKTSSRTSVRVQCFYCRPVVHKYHILIKDAPVPALHCTADTASNGTCPHSRRHCQYCSELGRAIESSPAPCTAHNHMQSRYVHATRESPTKHSTRQPRKPIADITAT